MRFRFALNRCREGESPSRVFISQTLWTPISLQPWILEAGSYWLMHTDKLLLHDEHMRRLSRPSERVHRNFMDYMYTENPFGENEQQFIFHEDDFVTLQLYEESWLDQFLHRVLLHCKKPFLRVCVTPKFLATWFPSQLLTTPSTSLSAKRTRKNPKTPKFAITPTID